MTERTPYRARVHSPGEVLEVQPYDFERPELIGGPLRTRLESGLAAWGRQLGMHLTATTRAVVDVAVDPFRIQSFGAFLASADVPALHAAAIVSDERAVYRVPVAEARYWAARMLGAAGRQGADDGPSQPLTAVERALALHVVEDHLTELHVATEALLPEPLVQGLAAEAPAGLDDDALAVVVTVGLLRRGERRQLALALPVGVVLAALGAVGARQERSLVTERIGAHLALAPVEVALRFDDTRVGPSTVLDLAAGDLIPLAHPAHRPLVVTLDGAAVLLAAVGGNGDRLACVVVGSDGGPA